MHISNKFIIKIEKTKFPWGHGTGDDEKNWIKVHRH